MASSGTEVLLPRSAFFPFFFVYRWLFSLSKITIAELIHSVLILCRVCLG